MRLIPKKNRSAWAWALLFAMIAGFWGSTSTGILSSNDGSHVALSRALILSGKPEIDEDVALTLGIDVAWKDGHYYSDRPPGTAFAASWAVLLGHQLDEPLLLASRRAGTMLLQPASRPFIFTYAKRSPKAPPLAGIMATASIVTLHSIFVGLIGLFCIRGLLARWQIGQMGQLMACLGLSLGTLWGIYSTTLYSHGSSMTAIAGSLLILDYLKRSAPKSSGRLAFAYGAIVSWAISCDYLLIVALTPMTLITVPRRYWLMITAGAMPIFVMTMVYHAIAFGQPWLIGYDFQQNFSFARSRAETFDGSFLDGMWVLWGAGRGAGVLVQSPLVFLGLGALIVGAKPCTKSMRLVLLSFVPWMIMVATHRTPWGGGTIDHRYLTPLLPIAGLGLGIAWSWIQLLPSRSKTFCMGLLALVFAFSSYHVWDHFLEMHSGSLGTSWWVGVVAGVFTFTLMILYHQRHIFGLSIKQDDKSNILN